MKPIQKGLAIIAGATLITVLAISFLGEGSKKGEQKDVVEADAKEAQGNTATDLGAANAAAAQEQGDPSATAVVTDASSSSPVAVSTQATSAKEGQSASDSEAVSTTTSGDAPAPPGPFHKNTVAGTPEMPAAPTAPTSENVDLPPPPMPQGLIDAPTSPAAPEANISKPEFVTKPQMNITAPEQPAAEVASPEAPADLTQNAPVETAAPTEALASPAVQVEKGSEAPVAVEDEKQSAPVEAVSGSVAVPSEEAPIAMPEKPSAPMVPAEILQSGVNVQSQPMQQHQQQPRVIFVPVPVYPSYQQPNMNQQWGGQAPQMNFMPPQPPVMGETAPAQGQ